MRVFLTVLEVVIGSASIVLVVTTALTGERYVTQQIEAVGSNLVYAEVVKGGPRGPAAFSDKISPGDLEAVRGDVAQVVDVAGTHDMQMAVIIARVKYLVSLIGVTEGFQRIRNLVILRGRYFDSEDMASRRKVCLLTQELAKLFFPAEDPMGKNARVGELSFTVIGVFQERRHLRTI